MNKTYLDTARMLVQVAPLVFRDSPFSLKGGTAINLFVRDMPRLSVDLDLVFTDHRLARLASINNALAAAADRLKAHRFTVRLQAAADTGDTKLFVRRDKIEVKIEANFVLRGTVHPVRTASLTTKAREALQAEVEIPVVADEDLYAGKLVAALDRQHPRDLFDVMQLLANGGITPEMRRTFAIYLACHNRPIHELLTPAPRDISQEYERTFAGMTSEPVARCQTCSPHASRWFPICAPVWIPMIASSFFLSHVQSLTGRGRRTLMRMSCRPCSGSS